MTAFELKDRHSKRLCAYRYANPSHVIVNNDSHQVHCCIWRHRKDAVRTDESGSGRYHAEDGGAGHGVGICHQFYSLFVSPEKTTADMFQAWCHRQITEFIIHKLLIQIHESPF